MDKQIRQQTKRGYCHYDGCFNLQRNHGDKRWGRFCDKHHYDSLRIRHESALRAGRLAVSRINTIGYRRIHRVGIICPDCGLVRLKTKLCTGRRCNSCCYKRSLAVTNPAYNRERLLGKYGLTGQDFDEMSDSQGGRCAICGEVPEPTGDRETGFVIDHCHSEDRVRGLLCNTCNSGLGMFNDDLDILASAASYLINSQLKDTG